MKPLVFVASDLGNEYPEILKQVLFAGAEVKPRGMLVKEATPFVLQLSDAKRCITSRPGFSEKLMWLEIASVLSGTFDMELYEKVARQAASMLSPQGAYGPRVRDQIPYVIDELSRDPDSRRAVVYVGRETDLRYSEHFEQACTMTWQFLIRDGKLDMIVNMRAWDLVWGLGYDVPVFVSVAMAVAAALEIQTGSFVCVAGSGHIYQRHFDMQAEAVAFRELPPMNAGTEGNPGDEWRETVANATRALDCLRTGDFRTPPVGWSEACAVWGRKRVAE